MAEWSEVTPCRGRESTGSDPSSRSSPLSFVPTLHVIGSVSQSVIVFACVCGCRCGCASARVKKRETSHIRGGVGGS